MIREGYSGSLTAIAITGLHRYMYTYGSQVCMGVGILMTNVMSVGCEVKLNMA